MNALKPKSESSLVLYFRFDSMDRMINEDRVKLEFYDSDGVKFSKLIVS